MNRVLLLLLLAACGPELDTDDGRRRDASTGAEGSTIRISLIESLVTICTKDPDDGLCVNLDKWCAEISTDTEAEWCPKWEAVKASK